MKTLLVSLLLLLTAWPLCASPRAAARPASALAPDTAASRETVVNADTLSAADSLHAKPRRGSLVSRFLAYFNDANKNKHQRRFDFSVIGGPHYSTDTKLGLGLVAAGLYRTDPSDTLAPPSNVSLFSDVSTVGFYMLGVRGMHLFPHDRMRADYTLYFYSFPSYYWGMGFDRGDDDGNKSKMKRWQAQAKVSLLFRLAESLYLGPTVAYDYTIGRRPERPELLDGQDRHTWNVGFGLSLAYDTRDALTQPHRGVYLSLAQMFRPTWLGNKYAFSTTDLRADGFIPAWHGATVAMDFRSTLNAGHPSWSMMALLGSGYSMRGYYEGRYRDRSKMEAQVELRQHVWRRNGIVLWVGAGTVFRHFTDIRMSRILPNYGVGYRWEFKKNVNVRLDYGFGKAGQSGFLFNINEAF